MTIRFGRFYHGEFEQNSSHENHRVSQPWSQRRNISRWCHRVWIPRNPRRILHWWVGHDNFQKEFPKCRQLLGNWFIPATQPWTCENIYIRSPNFSGQRKPLLSMRDLFHKLNCQLRLLRALTWYWLNARLKMKIRATFVCSTVSINSESTWAAGKWKLIPSIWRARESVESIFTAIFLFHSYALGELWKCALVKLFKNQTRKKLIPVVSSLGSAACFASFFFVRKSFIFGGHEYRVLILSSSKCKISIVSNRKEYFPITQLETVMGR